MFMFWLDLVECRPTIFMILILTPFAVFDRCCLSATLCNRLAVACLRQVARKKDIFNLSVSLFCFNKG